MRDNLDFLDFDGSKPFGYDDNIYPSYNFGYKNYNVYIRGIERWSSPRVWIEDKTEGVYYVLNAKLESATDMNHTLINREFRFSICEIFTQEVISFIDKM